MDALSVDHKRCDQRIKHSVTELFGPYDGQSNIRVDEPLDPQGRCNNLIMKTIDELGEVFRSRAFLFSDSISVRTWKSKTYNRYRLI
jgi:hypothetical protein